MTAEFDHMGSAEEQWAKMTQSLNESAFTIQMQKKLILDLREQIDAHEKTNQKLQLELDDVNARCDKLAPTLMSLTQERNQLAKDKAVLAEKCDSLRAQVEEKARTSEGTSNTTAGGCSNEPSTHSDSKQNTFELPIDLSKAKAFFLGNRCKVEYNAADDVEADQQRVLAAAAMHQECTSDADLNDVDDEVKSISSCESPPPAPPSCSPPCSPDDLEECARFRPTDNSSAFPETPPAKNSIVSTSVHSSRSNIRRNIFGKTLSSIRKRFNHKDEQGRKSATTENPHFVDDEIIEDQSLPVAPPIAIFTNIDEGTLPSMNQKKSKSVNAKGKRKLPKRSLTRSGKPAVPTRANHDASMELRARLKNAEEAVNRTTKALEDARRQTQHTNSMKTTQPSTKIDNDRLKDSAKYGGEYTKGMKVRKSRRVPEWRKALNRDLEAQRINRANDIQLKSSGRVTCVV